MAAISVILSGYVADHSIAVGAGPLLATGAAGVF